MAEHGHLWGPADLGAVVRSVREQNGMSQVQLSSMIGVSQRWLSELERGMPKVIDGRYFDVLTKLGIHLTYEVTDE